MKPQEKATEMSKDLIQTWASMAPKEDIYTQAAFTVGMLVLLGLGLAMAGEVILGFYQLMSLYL